MNYSGLAKYVLLGELDLASNDDDAQPNQFDIAERIKHPDYTNRFKYNDIALIRLDASVKFNEYIRPACLPEYSSTGFNAFATGWGRIDFDRQQSTHLLKVELSLYTYQECNELYLTIKDRHIDRGILNDTQICAGSYIGRGDTCLVTK